MDIIWQYSSKANSSNVHDFLLIIGTVLNLVKKCTAAHAAAASSALWSAYSCVPKKYSGAGIPCTFCATGDDIRYGSFVKKTVDYYLLILRLQTLPKLLVGSAFMRSRLTALIFRAEHRQIFIQRLKVQLDYLIIYPHLSLCAPAQFMPTHLRFQ